MQTPVAVLFCWLLENTNNNNLCVFVTRCLKCWMVCLVLTASHRSSVRQQVSQVLLSCCGRRNVTDTTTTTAAAAVAAVATVDLNHISPSVSQPVDSMYTSLEYFIISIIK